MDFYLQYHSSIKKDVLVSMESLVKSSTENWVGNDRYRGFVRQAKGVCNRNQEYSEMDNWSAVKMESGIQ